MNSSLRMLLKSQCTCNTMQSGETANHAGLQRESLEWITRDPFNMVLNNVVCVWVHWQSLSLTCLLAAPACWGCAGWWWCPAGRSRSVCWVAVWWSAGRGPHGDTPAPHSASRPCRTADPGPTKASLEILADPRAWTISSLQGERNKPRAQTPWATKDAHHSTFFYF